MGLSKAAQRRVKDFSGYDLASLECFVENYNREGLVYGDDFAALLRARETKLGERGEPNLYASLRLLQERARAQCFVSYGDLAHASGMAWTNTLRARMSGPKSHLDRLLDLCRSQRLPLLTAICVNKQNFETGLLKPYALSGFVACAKRLGYEVRDELAFLRQHQDECFRWGREQVSDI